MDAVVMIRGSDCSSSSTDDTSNGTRSSNEPQHLSAKPPPPITSSISNDSCAVRHLSSPSSSYEMAAPMEYTHKQPPHHCARQQQSQRQIPAPIIVPTSYVQPHVPHHNSNPLLANMSPAAAYMCSPGGGMGTLPPKKRLLMYAKLSSAGAGGGECTYSTTSVGSYPPTPAGSVADGGVGGFTPKEMPLWNLPLTSSLGKNASGVGGGPTVVTDSARSSSRSLLSAESSCSGGGSFGECDNESGANDAAAVAAASLLGLTNGLLSSRWKVEGGEGAYREEALPIVGIAPSLEPSCVRQQCNLKGNRFASHAVVAALRDSGVSLPPLSNVSPFVPTTTVLTKGSTSMIGPSDDKSRALPVQPPALDPTSVRHFATNAATPSPPVPLERDEEGDETSAKARRSAVNNAPRDVHHGLVFTNAFKALAYLQESSPRDRKFISPESSQADVHHGKEQCQSRTTRGRPCAYASCAHYAVRMGATPTSGFGEADNRIIVYKYCNLHTSQHLKRILGSTAAGSSRNEMLEYVQFVDCADVYIQVRKQPTNVKHAVSSFSPSLPPNGMGSVVVPSHCPITPNFVSGSSGSRTSSSTKLPPVRPESSCSTASLPGMGGSIGDLPMTPPPLKKRKVAAQLILQQQHPLNTQPRNIGKGAASAFERIVSPLDATAPPTHMLSLDTKTPISDYTEGFREDKPKQPLSNTSKSVAILAASMPDLEWRGSANGDTSSSLKKNHVNSSLISSNSVIKNQHHGGQLLHHHFERTLNSIPISTWKDRTVVIATGPFTGRRGRVVKWGNGWVTVFLLDKECAYSEKEECRYDANFTVEDGNQQSLCHNRRAADLHLPPEESDSPTGLDGIENSELKAEGVCGRSPHLSSTAADVRCQTAVISEIESYRKAAIKVEPIGVDIQKRNCSVPSSSKFKLSMLPKSSGKANVVCGHAFASSPPTFAIIDVHHPSNTVTKKMVSGILPTEGSNISKPANFAFSPITAKTSREDEKHEHETEKQESLILVRDCASKLNLNTPVSPASRDLEDNENEIVDETDKLRTFISVKGGSKLMPSAEMQVNASVLSSDSCDLEDNAHEVSFASADGTVSPENESFDLTTSEPPGKNLDNSTSSKVDKIAGSASEECEKNDNTGRKGALKYISHDNRARNREKHGPSSASCAGPALTTSFSFEEYAKWMGSAAVDRPRRCVRKVERYDDSEFERRKKDLREQRRRSSKRGTYLRGGDDSSENAEESSHDGADELSSVGDSGACQKQNDHEERKLLRPAVFLAKTMGCITAPSYSHCRTKKFSKGDEVLILSGSNTNSHGTVQRVASGWYHVELSSSCSICRKRKSDLQLLETCEKLHNACIHEER